MMQLMVWHIAEGVNQTLISVDNSDKCSGYTLQLNNQTTRKAVNVTMQTVAMTGWIKNNTADSGAGES